MDHPPAVGPYKPLEPLFESYWGTMWDACNTDDEQRLSLRLVDGSKLQSEERERLERAAVAVSGHQHATIVPVRAVASDRDGLTIASDPIEALSLSQLLKHAREHAAPLPIEAAMQIALDMLASVAFMHVRGPALHKGIGGFAYGGLTPDSFAVCADGRTRMLEMGAASVLRRFRMLSQDSQRIGYDPAEVLQVGIEVEAAADVFSIGVMVWEMLRNQRLFPGTVFHVVSKLRAGPLPRIDHDGARPWPAALSEIVARSLERLVDERFASAGEMATELRELDVQPSAARVAALLKPSGLKPRLPLPPRRERSDPPRRARSDSRRPSSDRPPKSRRTIPKQTPPAPPPRKAREAPPPRPISDPPESIEPVTDLATETPPLPKAEVPSDRPPARATDEPVSAAPPAPARANTARLIVAAVAGAIIAALVTLWLTGDRDDQSPLAAPSAAPTQPAAPPKAPPAAQPKPTPKAEPVDAPDAGASTATPAPKAPRPRPTDDRLPDDI